MSYPINRVKWLHLKYSQASKKYEITVHNSKGTLKLEIEQKKAYNFFKIKLSLSPLPG